jgi:CO/xanthine dehydrogenase Mo-binding subunit
MNASLPGPLNDNPNLDRWVAFPSPGKVTILTGRVELGQGVLTAMAQIAADELDVAMERNEVPLGVGEVTAGPTAAAIGNAVSHALGARIRDLPLTRERLTAALLKE